MIDLGRSQTRSNISSQIELWIQNSGTKMNRIPKTNQKKSGGGGGGEEEAVDSLLRAAEDELLLNLSLNSHMSRGISHSCNSHIDPDLDRRFQSLKSSRRPPTSTKNPPPQPPASDDGDLLARFAALKGDSISSSSSCFQESNCLQSDRGKISSSDAVDQDEVQKLIQWAIDAARLDPSPLTDSDDEYHRHDDDSSNDDDSNSDEGFSDHGGSKDNRKKGGRNKGQKGK